MTFRRFTITLNVFLAIFAALAVNADAKKPATPMTPLFNGKNLDGWVNVNCPPRTFTVRDGMIVCTGKPTGVLRSLKQYENFELELEWKHLHRQGNAGLFVWSGPIPVTGKPFTKAIEVQILDGRIGST